MYTKEQITKAIGQSQFNGTWTKETLCDVILAKLANIAQENDIYIQPLAVEIQNYEFGQDQLYLTIRINAAIVGYSPRYINDNLPNWHEIKKDLMSGQLSIHTKNKGIDESVFFSPNEMTFNCLNERPLNIGVVSVGDISGYLLPNGEPNITLIRLSILDGTLIIKAK